MSLKGVIFDLDGTLLDTSEGIIDAVKYTIRKLNYSELEDNKIKEFIGPPIQKSFEKFFNCSISEAQEAANIFRNYYKTNSLLKASPYPGIYELLSYIKENGCALAVATYKREDYALELLKEFGFDDYCSVMHGADNMNEMTKADIIKLCIEELGIEAEETIYVGDTEGDYLGARECGMGFVGVSYGFGFTDKSQYKYNVVTDCWELKKVIEKSIFSVVNN